MPKMVDLYYFPKGAKEVERVKTFEIDALDAVARFPDAYSLEAPKGNRTVVNLTPEIGDPESMPAFAPSPPRDEPNAPTD